MRLQGKLWDLKTTIMVSGAWLIVVFLCSCAAAVASEAAPPADFGAMCKIIGRHTTQCPLLAAAEVANTTAVGVEDMEPKQPMLAVQDPSLSPLPHRPCAVNDVVLWRCESPDEVALHYTQTEPNVWRSTGTVWDQAVGWTDSGASTITVTGGGAGGAMDEYGRNERVVLPHTAVVARILNATVDVSGFGAVTSHAAGTQRRFVWNKYGARVLFVWLHSAY
jgi:hypothetical protein